MDSDGTVKISTRRQIHELLEETNTKLWLHDLGYIEFRYMTVGDMDIIISIINSNASDREAAERILYNQLLFPKTSIEEFRKIEDSEFLNISFAFILSNYEEFRYIRFSTDLFKDFRMALDTYYKKYHEQLLSMFKPAIIGTVEIINTVKELNRSYNLVGKVQEFFSTLERATEELRRSTEAFGNWIEEQKELFNRFTEYWAQLQNQYRITEEQACLVLEKYKWFVTPSVGFALIVQIIIIDSGERRKDKEINNLFLHYFSNNNWKRLEEMVRKWKDNPLIRKRMKILLDCVNTLKCEGKKNINYANIIVPTLISQIDGIFTDFLLIKSLGAKTRYDDKKVEFEQYTNTLMNSARDETARDIFLNILFQHSSHGKKLKTPFYFNRHKIMHGENTRYGKSDYLIRAFLIIDYLYYLK